MIRELILSALLLFIVVEIFTTLGKDIRKTVLVISLSGLVSLVLIWFVDSEAINKAAIYFEGIINDT